MRRSGVRIPLSPPSCRSDQLGGCRRAGKLCEPCANTMSLPLPFRVPNTRPLFLGLRLSRSANFRPTGLLGGDNCRTAFGGHLHLLLFPGRDLGCVRVSAFLCRTLGKRGGSCCDALPIGAPSARHACCRASSGVVRPLGHACQGAGGSEDLCELHRPPARGPGCATPCHARRCAVCRRCHAWA